MIRVLKAAIGPFLKSGALVFVAHVLARGNLMVATIFVARHFTPSEFASYSFFQLTIATLATFASLGLGVTASRYFAGLTLKTPDTSFAFGTLWLTSLAVGVIAALLILLVPPHWLGVTTDVSMVWYAFGVLIFSSHIVPAGAMIGLQLYTQAIFTSCLSAAVMAIGMVWAIQTQSIQGAFVALLASFLTQVLGDSYMVVRRVGVRLLRNTTWVHKTALAQVANLAGPMFLVSVVNSGGLWMTARTIKQVYPDPNAFPMYVIAMQWVSLLLLVPAILSKVSLPIFVQTSGRKNQNVLAGSVGLAMGAAGAGALFVIALSPWFTVIYGENYQIERLLILPFVISAIFSAPLNILGSKLVVENHQWAWLWITILGTFLLLSLVWLGQSFGAMGVGIAHSASYLLMFVVVSVLVWRSF